MAETAEKPTYLAGWRLGVVIASLFSGSFLIALDTNIVNVAIPYISTEFQALDDVLWYGAAYLLTITAFQPVYGSMYKFFNTTVVYRTSILIFEVGSILCAAATNSSMFIAGRAIAGFGAAGLLQGALSIITQVVPLEKRPMYMGIVISVFAITVCIGPPLGGLFTEHISWRWCFWINLPIGAVVILVLSIFLKLKKSSNEYRDLQLRQKLLRMDPIGCVLFIGAICSLLLALQWGGQTKPWSSPTVIGLLISSVALTGIFIFVQIKLGDAALIPLSVLSKRSIWTGALVLYSLGSSTYLNAFFLPFYFQAVQDIKPLDSGVALIPYLLPQIVAMAIVGVFVKLWGHYVPWMIVGEVISIVGQALLTQIDIQTTTVKWAAYMVLAGLGSGMASNLPYTAVQVTLSEKDVPTGNAIAVLFYQLGGALSISLGQTVTISTVINHVSKRLPHLPSASVLKAGAAGLSSLTTSQDELYILREIWSTAISRTMILCVALLAISVPFTLGMEWLNAKTIAAAREQKWEDPNSKELPILTGAYKEDVKQDVQNDAGKDTL